MKISQIDLISCPDGGADASGDILVRIHASGGLTGLGEAVTDTSSKNTSPSNVLAWLKLYCAQIVQASCLNINDLNRRLDIADAGATPGCPSARAAIEMAAFDVVGNARSRPLHEALGGGYRTQFDMFFGINVQERDLAEKAAAAVRQGYAGIRLEILQSPQRNENARQHDYVAAIREVLETCGPSVAVQIVCHRALVNERTASMLLEGVHEGGFRRNVSLVQPLDEINLVGHGRLREKHASPLVLEESVSSVAMMAQILRHSAADCVVLDPWRVGGLHSARKVASLCEAAAIA